MTLALSCDQLCPITADRELSRHSSEGTSTLIIRALMISALMISVASSLPPVSVYQCQMSVHINATYQCLPVHINATYQCPSELPFSATYQCQSVTPISAANQCNLTVPVSATQ
ncbi:unnamed protein product [Staurois parvus]|uniref:Uncharacterized protein n=1 Tax=Staurois parvus TaxID=386267 RepID=A0ABN9FCC8_9NEOB|nr:unnamed protein product [Staurois parvus]